MDIGNGQIVGERDQQEDYFAHQTLHGAVVAVLADGMGGHARGEQASLLVVKSFLDTIQAQGLEQPADTLIKALFVANGVLAKEKQRAMSDMGTTLVACVVKDQQLWWISVGDSLLYRLRQTDMALVNVAHHYHYELQQRAYMGECSHDEVKNDPQAGSLLSSVSGRVIPQWQVSAVPLSIESGDRFLLASDGIESLNQSRIQQILSAESGGNAQVQVDVLLAAVEDQKDDYQDNCTLLLLKDKSVVTSPFLWPLTTLLLGILLMWGVMQVNDRDGLLMQLFIVPKTVETPPLPISVPVVIPIQKVLPSNQPAEKLAVDKALNSQSVEKTGQKSDGIMMQEKVLSGAKKSHQPSQPIAPIAPIPPNHLLKK